MRSLVVLLVACGASPPPAATSTPQTFVYRVLDLRRGVALGTVTLAIDNAKAAYEVVGEQGRAVDGGFDHFQREGGGKITGTAKRTDEGLVLDFRAPRGGANVGLTCIEKPFVIAPATATATDDGCGTPTWNDPTEQITLLECKQPASGDVIGEWTIALLAPPPGVEEIRTARVREGCPPLDPEARPLLRHATAGRVAPLFMESKKP